LPEAHDNLFGAFSPRVPGAPDHCGVCSALLFPTLFFFLFLFSVRRFSSLAKLEGLLMGRRGMVSHITSFFFFRRYCGQRFFLAVSFFPLCPGPFNSHLIKKNVLLLLSTSVFRSHPLAVAPSFPAASGFFFFHQ